MPKYSSYSYALMQYVRRSYVANICIKHYDTELLQLYNIIIGKYIYDLTYY